MSYKDILVFLDGSTDNNARMGFALSLAQDYGARLTGVDVDAAAAFEGEWAERAKSRRNPTRKPRAKSSPGCLSRS